MKTEPQDEKQSPQVPDENAPGDAPGELCGKPTPYPEHPCFLPKDHDGFCQAEAYWCIDHSAPRIGGVCVGCVKATVGSMAWDIDELRDDYNRLQERIDDCYQCFRVSSRDLTGDLFQNQAAQLRMDKTAPSKLLFSRVVLANVGIGLLTGKRFVASVFEALDRRELERHADLRVEHKTAKSLVESTYRLWRLYFPKGGRDGDES